MYSAKIDGEPTTFGTSGFLYRSNKLMYDRKTNSLWSSLVGRPVIGELAPRDDLVLDYFPVSLTTWAEWLAEHPDTTVVSNETPYYPAQFYGPESSQQSIYFSYREDPRTMFPVWNQDDRLLAKDEVLGVVLDDAKKAYPVNLFQEERLINDTIGDTDIVLVASGTLSDGRVFDRGDVTFESIDVGSDGVIQSVIDTDRTAWQVEEAGLTNADNSTVLPRIPTLIYFWFGWYAFHPDTLLYEGGSTP